MPRYIDADEFVKRVIQYPRQSTKTIGLALADTPTADVMEVKHGKWVGNSRHQACSVCHTTYCIPDGQDGVLDMTFYNFCPNCGAKMDGKETEDVVH